MINLQRLCPTRSGSVVANGSFEPVYQPALASGDRSSDPLGDFLQHLPVLLSQSWSPDLHGSRGNLYRDDSSLRLARSERDRLALEICVRDSCDCSDHYLPTGVAAGPHRFFSSMNERTRALFAEELIDIVEALSRKRIGALIAIERGINLKQYLETGTVMDAELTPELVYTVFHSGTTLHDGGMIVGMSNERIAGAGCVFPLIQRELIALVVSEETGAISIAISGKLERALDKTELRERLNDLLSKQDGEEGEEGDDEES